MFSQHALDDDLDDQGWVQLFTSLMLPLAGSDAHVVFKAYGMIPAGSTQATL